MEELDLYLKLFLVFFKIGLFGFGGGYAMLPLIQKEVVDMHQWISISDFTDMVAVSQMTPGPISFNLATYIGYTATGNILGAAIATVAVSIPSLIIMIPVCKYLVRFRNNYYVDKVIQVLKITIIGLIGAAALLLLNRNNFTDYTSIIIFCIAFIASFRWKINPILLIIIAGVLGYFLY